MVVDGQLSAIHIQSLMHFNCWIFTSNSILVLRIRRIFVISVLFTRTNVFPLVLVLRKRSKLPSVNITHHVDVAVWPKVFAESVTMGLAI